MDLDTIWSTIDAERAHAADLLDSLDDDQWQTPSLCDGWRVREVAAHLTLAHTGAGSASISLIRAGGSFNRMIRDTAIRQARQPTAEFGTWLRAAAGSRRKAVGVTPMEPLLDILVHQQDIARPLGISVQMPSAAAGAAAERVWRMGFPFWARRRLTGVELVATDADFRVGAGGLAQAPIAELLMLLTGRGPDIDQLTGPGAARVRELTAERRTGR